MKENFEKQSIDAGQMAFESSQNAKPILSEITKKSIMEKTQKPIKDMKEN
jgi:hypothetical protein